MRQGMGNVAGGGRPDTSCGIVALAYTGSSELILGDFDR